MERINPLCSFQNYWTLLSYLDFGELNPRKNFSFLKRIFFLGFCLSCQTWTKKKLSKQFFARSIWDMFICHSFIPNFSLWNKENFILQKSSKRQKIGIGIIQEHFSPDSCLSQTLLFLMKNTQKMNFSLEIFFLNSSKAFD